MPYIMVLLWIRIFQVIFISILYDLESNNDKNKAMIEKMYSNYKTSFPNVNEISATELLMLKSKEENIMIIDCREDHEINVSMIKGAITKQDFLKRLQNETNFEESHLIFYCTIGYRSGLFIQELEVNMDIKKKCFNLVGSVLLYSHAGGKFVNMTGNEVSEIHTYGETWDLVHDNYQAIY